jgi:hypothetical protein
MTAESILSGSRGRRFCVAVACALEPGLDRALFGALVHPENDGVRDALASVLAVVDPGPIVGSSELELLAPFIEAVDAARYWQEPDEVDRLLLDDRLVGLLGPVASELAAAPATAWWTSPMAPSLQRLVRWGGVAVSPGDASSRLDRWRADTLDDEHRARNRPGNVAAALSGRWWSTPTPVDLVTSTRSLSELGALKLALVEDGFVWEHAIVSRVVPERGVRIYEITSPEAWAELVDSYPLDVGLSRRHDWLRATGVESRWFIPDWVEVSADFDGVHLSGHGYLCTAGRALAVRDGHTVLAGWSPDETHWLTDRVSEVGPETAWRRAAGSNEWHPDATDDVKR